MKKRWNQIPILVILLVFVLHTSAYAAENRTIKVGLAHSSAALASANLENSVGSGYSFGYYDGGNTFIALGSTDETQISMLKTKNIYLQGGSYYESNPGNVSGVVGCYHIQLPGSYGSFEAAKNAASTYGGFPVWASGTYYARVGAYASSGEAESAKSALGLSDGYVVGTTSSGISVTKTKTTKILFQFDGGGSPLLAVRPMSINGEKTVTWFKGYKYYGDFRYERIGGGNLTVVNFVNMDDYAKGILPYEMSASWPLEALKAQAVAAKSYVLSGTGNRHKSQNFDVCNATCCQVYYGTNRANENSDRAVDETSGIYAWHSGKIAQTFYYASNGGASESVENVWSATLPYLVGVMDPYEQTIESNISGYRWKVTYTGPQLAARLKQRGYSCGSSIVDLKIKELTSMGNVYAIEMTDNNGKVFNFKKENVRTILGLNSIRFQLGGSGGGTVNAYYVDEGGKTLASFGGLWTIGDGGNKTQISGEAPYAITSAGSQSLTLASGGGGGGASSDGTFVISGAGNGHNVGMSQWGAYAMAKQGKGYEEILKFYYTGIDLH